jgi:hypothetical protein
MNASFPYTAIGYIVYLLLSVGLTVWVARTLFQSGRVFLVDSFLGNETLADSVNRLLVVGFYLVNIGYVSVALKYGDKPSSLDGLIEHLSTKVGVVMLVLGGMHFFNLYVFSRMRKRAILRNAAPPVQPSEFVAPMPGWSR